MIAAKKTILVVDDEQDFIDTICVYLKDEYEFRTAHSGAECLKEVTDKKPDLIIMDVIMNGVLDGLETARKLKQNDTTREIPIIILTSVDEVFNYRNHVPDEYFPRDCWLDKPVKQDALKAAGKRLIG
jgi:CheY-like chemotaxis protein